MQTKSSPMKKVLIAVLPCWTFVMPTKAQTVEHAITVYKPADAVNFMETDLD